MELKTLSVRDKLGRFLHGNSPANKGLRWYEFRSKEANDKYLANLEIGRKMLRTDRWTFRSKKILMLKNGIVIGVFKNSREAFERTGINARNIRAVSAGKRNRAGGYEWKYEKKVK